MVDFTTPRRALVVGLGSSGLAAARLLARDGAEVWVTDRRPAPELTAATTALPPGCSTFLGSHPDSCLEGVELVVTSPGVPATAPLLQLARGTDIPVVTELELAWMHRPQAELVAVTGSNGKSTVTTLIAEMLITGGVAAVAGGNLGTPASDLVQQQGWQTWVLEVSSFQAELLTAMRPRVAVFLNLSQDHLERHPTLDEYLGAKQRLFSFQEPADAAVLNADDASVRETRTAARRLLFSLEERADACLDGDRLVLGGQPLISTREMRLGGLHNAANALAAAVAAHDLGIASEAVATTLATFEGLEHRHRTVAEAGGVRWVNDSKATNVGAALAALRGYPDGSVHLILGGLGKGQDFSALAGEVRRAAARLYLIGEDAALISEALNGAAEAELSGTLAAAVRSARRHARAGHTVLLAPACASFDQFANYCERGASFARLVRDEVSPCP